MPGSDHGARGRGVGRFPHNGRKFRHFFHTMETCFTKISTQWKEVFQRMEKCKKANDFIPSHALGRGLWWRLAGDGAPLREGGLEVVGDGHAAGGGGFEDGEEFGGGGANGGAAEVGQPVAEEGQGGGGETRGEDVGAVKMGSEVAVQLVKKGSDGCGFVGAQGDGQEVGWALDPVVEESAEADGVEGRLEGPGGVVVAAGAGDGDVPGGKGGEGVADGGGGGGREGKVEEGVEGGGGGEGAALAGRAGPGGGAEEPSGGGEAAFVGGIAGVEGEGFEAGAAGGGLDFGGGEEVVEAGGADEGLEPVGVEGEAAVVGGVPGEGGEDGAHAGGTDEEFAGHGVPLGVDEDAEGVDVGVEGFGGEVVEEVDGPGCVGVGEGAGEEGAFDDFAGVGEKGEPAVEGVLVVVVVGAEVEGGGSVEVDAEGGGVIGVVEVEEGGSVVVAAEGGVEVGERADEVGEGGFGAWEGGGFGAHGGSVAEGCGKARERGAPGTAPPNSDGVPRRGVVEGKGGAVRGRG